MLHVLPRLVCVIVLLGWMGCATPNDPEAGRFSLETRAQESGRSTGSEGLQVFARRRVGRNEPLAEPDRFAPPADSTGSPETPAGRQLSWLLTQFNGPTSRELAPHFSQDFLKRTPETEVRSAISQWKRDEFGDGPAEVHEVEETNLGRLTAVIHGKTTGRYCRVRIGTDKWGRIGSLSFAAILDYAPGQLAEWSKIETKLTSLSGSTAMAAFEITDTELKPVYRHRAEVSLSIDALAGLYIAQALTEQVAVGKARWDEPMPIVDEFKSLIGGRMQLEPSETEFPLSQYLSLMLGQGDNTAFDHLLLRVERQNVESSMARFCTVPQKNRPFLATMEYFRIKLGLDRKLPGMYAAADESGRRALLAVGGPVERSVPSLAAARKWRLPFETERIGWFASADDCCRLLAELSRASRRPGMEPLANALRMTDGMEPSATWTTAAFKSGAEPGVLAMVWLLERHDGRRFVLSLIANDPVRPVSQSDLTDCAAAAVKLLGRGDPKK